MSSISNYYQTNFGPWALIAGASEGLGAAYAREIASKGLNVILIARGKEKLEELAKEIGETYSVDAVTVELDLSNENLIAELSKRIKGLEIGLFVYNAALSPIGLFHNNSLEIHEKVVAVNCLAPMKLSYHFGNLMKERGKGGIILMSSLAGLQGNPIHSHYSASRAYIINLAEGLWEELKKSRVKVMTCLAGPTSTPNYYRSAPKDIKTVNLTKLTPETVARQAVKALRKAKKPIFIPGTMNKISSFILQGFLTRKARVLFMGKMARNMYGEDKNYSNK